MGTCYTWSHLTFRDLVSKVVLPPTDSKANGPSLVDFFKFFFFFFGVDHFLNTSLNLLHHFCFMFCFFLATSMRDLSSPTTDPTYIPCIGK